MLKYKRIVIKVGTKVIASKEKALDTDTIKDIVSQISSIKSEGVEIILVTSGAIGAGMGLLALKKRPQHLPELQAAAAIGQSHLMHVYSEYFRAKGSLAGQILLTQEDFDDRKRYLNIKYTIETLLKKGAVPIINENDTVSTEEIRFGDNDALASLVADLVEADALFILTDVDGLMDERCNVVSVVERLTPRVLKLARSSSCEMGTGGMASKLNAVKRAISAGIGCVIANGKERGILLKIVSGENRGTFFKGQDVRHIAKKRWIAYSSRPKGAISVDDGAKDALSGRDKSLLASGITGVEGDFDRGDTLKIKDLLGKEFGRGITNYSSSEILKIKGLKTGQIKSVLGYKEHDEVIHKDNLVIL